jgi:uncharacterized membrane protein YfcA
MDSIEFALSAVVIFFAYLVRGVSGFGSALVAVPLLVHFLPLTFVVPWVVVMDTLAALVLARSGQRDGHVRWTEIGWMVPASLVGIVIGIELLVNVDRGPLMLVLGLFVAAFGMRHLLGLHGKAPVSRSWALPAGMLGGGIGALFATGGPPMVIYLTHRLRDKAEFRATLSGLFLIDGALRTAGLALAGLLFQDHLGGYLLAGAPLMAAGLYAGNHIHLNLGQWQMEIAITLLLIASGVSLLWRTAASAWSAIGVTGS